MNGQGEQLPAAVGQVNGESDTVAERAGVSVRETRRPIPAEPVEPPPDPERKIEDERREAAEAEDVPPDAEPTD
ncbi:MAG: hypothetical protein HOV96_29765 [Nonomuraea sp.]|nr:hypothetical protein [Nonomuraea sp.]NUP62444.1 hypothetical protein [Nonomuraea sp.]NUP81735.1 hypothetical protein [Nonomuraea sp.]